MAKKITSKIILKGIMDMMPLNLAVIPWGILCGSLAIQKGFSVFEALLMPLLVFAGSAQLVATELIGGNAPLATILFTTFIISSRHFLYGLALKRRFNNVPGHYRVSIAFLLTDELFALSTHRKAFQGKLPLLYAIFTGSFFYFNWLIWNIIGIVAGSYLPDLTTLGLDFAIAVTFIALVIPTINNIPTFITVMVAGVCSIYFKINHWQLDLVISSVIAMSCGYLSYRLIEKKINKKTRDKGSVK